MTHTGQRTAPNKIGFLGCGHMGRAILSGLLARDVVSASQIHVSARSSALATAERFGVNAGAPHELLERCDVLILAIKPQQLSALEGWVAKWREMFDTSQRAPLMISLLAGVTLAQLRALIPDAFSLTRVMPNLPAEVGLGVTLCCAERRGSDDVEATRALEQTTTLFEPLGHVETFDHEDSLHAATAISGCGPAYLFNVIEALADAGVHEGLKRDVALRLAAHTVWGSGALAATEHPAILKDRVTSPRGVTIAGVRSLERAGVRGAVIEAVIAASERSRAMSERGS